MAKLEAKYRLEGKALPPRPIKVAIGDWGGSAEQKKEHGSHPQAWHCPAFAEACIHGFELLYQYETELRVINVDGKVQFHWSLDKEPGEGADPRNDFIISHPPITDYLFKTSLDIQAPPGYVLRVEPHPRFYRDETTTVAAAVCGHVQSEWWPKKLFMVFKIPPPGQQHIFRQSEPYAQVLCIPRDDDVVLREMSPQEREQRRTLEEQMVQAMPLIGKRIWVSDHNVVFSDFYTVLSRAFARDGLPGVESLVKENIERYNRIVPEGKPIAEYLEMAKAATANERFVEAMAILQYVLSKIDPNNAEVYRQLAILQWAWKIPRGAVFAMRRAVELAPNQPTLRLDLASLYQLVNRLDLARLELQAALAIDPTCAPARQLLEQLSSAA
jgi:hypothetical protein